jgi:hypothetical protein
LYHHNRRGHPYRLDIHHRPWFLQVARAVITTITSRADPAARITRRKARALPGKPQCVNEYSTMLMPTAYASGENLKK